MKILIQSINYPPESISTGKYNGEMAEWLAARGHEVTVITALIILNGKCGKNILLYTSEIIRKFKRLL